MSSFGDGTYVVGTDIVAGTYKSTGPSESGGICSWFRLRDTTGNDGSIIALDLGKGPATVTVARTDGALKTSGCVTWRKVS